MEQDGNVIHFISKIENVDFKESLEILAERVGIKLPTLEGSVDNKRQELKEKIYEINKLAALFYHEALYKPTSKLAQEYVKKRKLDNKTLKSFFILASLKFISPLCLCPNRSPEPLNLKSSSATTNPSLVLVSTSNLFDSLSLIKRQ